jgi:hypothetical protein
LKVLAFGEIMDGGISVFSSVAKVDADLLIISFGGSIRIDNPYRYLEQYLLELGQLLLQQEKIGRIEFDFKELDFCNSNGFYIIMDITEMIIDAVPGSITVKRLKGDDWQQETLPILLNVDEPEIETRTTFEEFADI